MRPFLLSNRQPREAPGLPAVLLAMVAAGLCGCASFRTEWGKPIDAEHPSFSEGSTPVATVLHELGPPAKVSALPGSFVFLYEHSVLTEFQFGFSADCSLLRFVKFVRAWDWIERENLLLTFNDAGVLCGVDGDHWRERLSGGGAAQIVFAAVSLTDPALRRQRAGQHRWGRSCLDPPRVTLNAGQSLQSGEYGLQLNLAPKYAGQQSLEMEKPVKPRKKKFPGLASPR